jgi:hypothetical protein
MPCDWYSSIKLIVTFKNSKDVKEIIVDSRKWYCVRTWNDGDDSPLLKSRTNDSDSDDSPLLKSRTNDSDSDSDAECNIFKKITDDINEYVNLHPNKVLYENGKYIKETYKPFIDTYVGNYKLENVQRIIKIASAWIRPDI